MVLPFCPADIELGCCEAMPVGRHRPAVLEQWGPHQARHPWAANLPFSPLQYHVSLFFCLLLPTVFGHFDIDVMFYPGHVRDCPLFSCQP